MEKIKLTFPDGKILEVEKDKSLKEVADSLKQDEKFPILAAKVNNRLMSLCHVLNEDCKIEFVTYRSKEGREVYRRTATFVMYMAIAEIYNNTRIVIGHSLASGFYYDFYTDTPVNNEVLDHIKERMNEIIKRDSVFKKLVLKRDEAIHYFKERAMADKVRLLENSDLEEIIVYENGRFSDLKTYPLAYSTNNISKFDLKTYGQGFVIRFPRQNDFHLSTDMGNPRKLYEIYQESKSWGKILSVNNVGRLNQIINNKSNISELIKISESLHEKKIAKIADEITARKSDLRVILIAGPSSSGKTSFSKRLSIHLRVNGLRPIAISLDDYFVSRERCPRDETGDYDFEHIDALDVTLFNQHLVQLLDGKEVEIPRFDFETGNRKSVGHKLRIADDQIMIVEGIHGLNEKLTESVSHKNKYKIYVSALTQLSIDDHNRISTTDSRILRRMIRDKNFRNYEADATLMRFPSVRRGEERWIFPYQEEADVMFNSALVYELAVLKDFAIPLLKSITHDNPAYTEAQRLLEFLKFFQSVPSSEIPPTSLLREFIGGSTFHY